ncbi:uncharacterized protein LOC128932337 isoform X2 [Callithrix jacchus]
MSSVVTGCTLRKRQPRRQRMSFGQNRGYSTLVTTGWVFCAPRGLGRTAASRQGRKGPALGCGAGRAESRELYPVEYRLQTFPSVSAEPSTSQDWLTPRCHKSRDRKRKMRGMGKAKVVIFRTSGAPGPALGVPERVRSACCRPQGRTGACPGPDGQGRDADAALVLVLMLRPPRADSRSATHRAELRLGAPGPLRPRAGPAGCGGQRGPGRYSPGGLTAAGVAILFGEDPRAPPRAREGRREPGAQPRGPGQAQAPPPPHKGRRGRAALPPRSQPPRPLAVPAFPASASPSSASSSQFSLCRAAGGARPAAPQSER